MHRIWAVMTVAAVLGLGFAAGCGERAGTGAAGTTVVLPSLDKDLVVVAVMPKDEIGEELPSEGLGSVNSTYWKSTLGGYTQKSYSEALGFPPGTKLTVHNLSKSTTHTLNVVKVIAKPPADFPRGIKLFTGARGEGKLEAGYASGPIRPGKFVTITLVKAGIYLIGCAYHYNLGMHDVFVVEPKATPGVQATPPKGGGGTSSSGSGW